MIRCTILAMIVNVAAFTVATCERTVIYSKHIAQFIRNLANWNEKRNVFFF